MATCHPARSTTRTRSFSPPGSAWVANAAKAAAKPAARAATAPKPADDAKGKRGHKAAPEPVKGKKEAVRIFALLGDPEVAANAAFGQLRARHLAMLEAYRRQRWDEARMLIAECRALDHRLDDLYDVYATRIHAMQQNPPGPDWDGVFVATTK